MKNFEIGQPVYFWQFSEALGHLELTMCLYCGIKREHENPDMIIHALNSSGIFSSNVFSSRDEAYDSMIKQLQERR